jgi:hypothetical protein
MKNTALAWSSLVSPRIVGEYVGPVFELAKGRSSFVVERQPGHGLKASSA